MNTLLEAWRKLTEDELEEGKNYPNLSNAVESAEILYYILKNKSIKASCIEEDDIYKITKCLKGNSVSYRYNELPGYVCLSRDITLHPKINESSWGWAVILDGNKLTDKYKIRPVNQRYAELTKTQPNYSGTSFKPFRIKALKDYINASGKHKYTILIAKFPETEIDKKSYEELRQFLDRKNMQLNSKGNTYAAANKFSPNHHVKKDVKDIGSKWILQNEYYYDVDFGGPQLKKSEISDYVISWLFKLSNTLNDTEEKAVFPKIKKELLNYYNSTEFKANPNNKVNQKGVVKATNVVTQEDEYVNGMDISGCIKGIVVPQYAQEMLQNMNFDYHDIPRSCGNISHRNSNRADRDSYEATRRESITIAKYIQLISNLIDPEWKIISYISEKDRFKTTSLNHVTKNNPLPWKLTLDKENKLKDIDQLKYTNSQGKCPKDLHLRASQKLNLSDAYVIQPEVLNTITTDQGIIESECEPSVCIQYSPSSQLDPQLTRICSRALLYAEDSDGKKYIAVQVSNNIFELPGGGLSSQTDDPREVMLQELSEEMNLKRSDLEVVEQLPSYWCSLGITKWVKDHVYKKENRWSAYYNYFYLVKLKSILDKNKLIINTYSNNGAKGEITYWSPVDVLLDKQNFVKSHTQTWVSAIERYIKNKKEVD